MNDSDGVTKPLKVSVTVKLDINPDAWALEYGFDATDTAAIREDVKNYIQNAVHDHLSGTGMLASITQDGVHMFSGGGFRP